MKIFQMLLNQSSADRGQRAEDRGQILELGSRNAEVGRKNFIGSDLFYQSKYY
ncbi:hypothetical protein D1BOALGB6SA_209 [Olavius sp. associated proteobacterium Delta 1]|nr:hypothetical protein D1BOALGB6SA_209 [Olavius sp. associated proteobacterium Delta 1]